MPGLVGMHTGRNRKRPPQYPCLLAKAVQPDLAGFNYTTLQTQLR
ncbi:hypothetical protein [Oculatella sp. FACHB-28]|nr:hypothetical protein [Oculatella sp. FACHB-28]